MNTGSIERSAKRRWISYLEADFEVFRPTEATGCIDWGEIWRGGVDPRFTPPRQGCVKEWTKGPLLYDKFLHIGATIRIGPKTAICTEILPKYSQYKRPAWAYPLRDFHEICRLCTTPQVKFVWICSLGYGVMGILSWGCLVALKFTAPPSGETMRLIPKSFFTEFTDASVPSQTILAWVSTGFRRITPTITTDTL